MKSVQELIDDLSKLNPGAIIEIYDERGNPVPPNKITVADNDGDTPTNYHLYSSDKGPA